MIALKQHYGCLAIVLDFFLVIFAVINIVVDGGDFFDYFTVLGHCILVWPIIIWWRMKKK